MYYVDTPIFQNDKARIKNQIDVISAQRAKIKEIKRKFRSKQDQRLFESIPQRLKTLTGKLERLSNLTCPSWDLVHYLQACDNSLWDDLQIDAWNKTLANHEGRGEASLRLWYGLPAAAATTEDVDLPEIDGEAKNAQGRRKDGKFQLQTVQAGKSGRKAYTRWMMYSAELGLFKDLPENVREALAEGELSQSIIYGALPQELKESLLGAVLPSIVFTRYEFIDFTTRNGFLHVINTDFDSALSFQCITKCGPKYALKKEYLVNRLRRSRAFVATREALHLLSLKERVSLMKSKNCNPASPKVQSAA